MTLYRQADARPTDPIGGKARALADLKEAGFRIPPWFALAPPESAGSHSPAPPTLESLAPALDEICPHGELFAVRSSARDEDGTEHSFAGQLDSFLQVSCEDVPARIAAVWASATSERVLHYRRERGIDAPPGLPGVLIQRMVTSELSGVAFGADPVTGDRDTVIMSAVEGLGDALVSGQAEGQTYRLGPDRQVTREFEATPILTEDQVGEIAALTRRTGAHFGRPQDVEWTIAGGELFLLQSRPITTIAATPEGELNVWDNSNIIESYSGLTTPLTTTFARSAYEGVYRQFCRILRVPRGLIATNDKVFKGMLGSINGRIYYNLLNWYRVLSMLPGYQLNRRFMEQMMGVKEPLPEHVAAEIGHSNKSGRLADAGRLLISFGSLLANLFTLESSTRRFYRRLDEALRPPDVPLKEMSSADLAAHYRELESRLLTRWDAPLVNDFFCMIFYGILKQLGEKWIPGERPLHDELLQGGGEMISAEPAIRVRKLAALARETNGLAGILVAGSLDEIERASRAAPEFHQEYLAYLDKFGERCLEELKLETPTLHDDPLLLLRAIGNLAQAAPVAPPTSAARPAAEDPEEIIAEALAGHPLRKPVFRWVLGQARRRVRSRENLRFERTRLFGRVRRIFVELGRRFHADGWLGEPRDVFHLELAEALAAAEEGAGTAELAALATRRKAEFARFRQLPVPPNRFETRGGPPYQVPVATPSPHESPPAESAGQRTALGCSPGIAEARVRVIHDPRQASLEHGEIIVAHTTDPGWILLFPLAAGIIVERGSPLSHSAIVARELGIPAVVSMADATSWLQSGDRVIIDGATGVVRKLDAQSPSPS
jgi:phosphohistidine swiveling domain-containing protein